MPEQSEILGRYSVGDLIEQTLEDMERGDELFYAAKGELEIVGDGVTNLICWWRIKSGETVYEARRFKNFVWCECKSFQFSRKMCKHLALTTGVKCERCGELRARTGKLCVPCDQIVNRFKTKGR